MDPVATDRRPAWKKLWALLAAVLLVLALAAAAWYAWRMRQLGADHDAQFARLQAAKEREAALVNALAAVPADPSACPPGQVLKRTASPPGAQGGERPALPGSAPAASAVTGSRPAASRG